MGDFDFSLIVFPNLVFAVNIKMAEEARGICVRDVKADAFIAEYAEHLKNSDKFELPVWSDTIKTACFKELAPYGDDWYYIRAASIARKVYLLPGQQLIQTGKVSSWIIRFRLAIAQPVHDIINLSLALLRSSARNGNRSKLFKSSYWGIFTWLDSLVSHPIQGTLNFSSTVLGLLSLLLWQHLVHSCEFSSWVQGLILRIT